MTYEFMDIKKFISLFTLSFLVLLPVWGQTGLKPYYTFLNYCKYADYSQDRLAEIKWLKFLLKADTCDGLADKISKLKSVNEFKVPLEKSRPMKVASWTNEFPEIYGIKSEYDIADAERIIGMKINPRYFFTDLSDFWQFKNLKVLDFTRTQRYNQSLCLVAWNFKHYLQTIIIDWSSMDDVKKCKFLRMPDIIIAGDFLGGDVAINDHIIGIEHYVGGVTQLDKYPNLRFLGFTMDNQFSSLSKLVVNQNITHLTMNSVIDQPDLSSLGELQNLAYLGLTCVKNERDLYSNMNVQPLPCDKPYLNNLDFLKNLTWLRSLNLSYSGLDNVDDLVSLEQLESLDLSHNRIRHMPDFSELKDLKNLNTKDQKK